MLDPTQIIQTVSQLTIASACVFLLIGGMRGKWVFGWMYNDMKAMMTERIAAITAEKNEWKQRALEATALAERATAQMEAAKGRAGR